ncbi:hypothetical protein M413DRAFT_124034 [Hebeloma cylindrosporum]|uniref:F-box domain-containing protein n=1 Tax=Hebeloma cylindrosporum TaxID=76867 RepID=A0A0C2XYV0_HEBCY|nr:hypothetical protein M413DRAFT_124034 [Hebeloma cylindrosporum h7]
MQNLQAFHVLSTSTFKLRDEMGDKNVQKFPDLPQEIIDIIVRDIASQDLTREALKACSLVSKSFCSSCRRHLFSDLELVSDKWQSQAARLMEILQNPDNVGLVACVRSLTLVDVPSRRTYSFLGSSTLGRHLYETKLAALTLAARLRLREDNLIKALDLLVQAPNLESFTLHVRRGISFWQREASTRTMKKAVLMACTAPLTTVRLSNFFGIEGSLIARVIHCRTLKELALTNIALRYCDDDANLDLQPITSQIERLDLRRVSYLHVFRTMGRPNLPPFPMSYPFVAFPHLRHLIISGPWLDAEVDALWHFMLGIADTLETLEMHEIKWQDPIQFGKLSSLRNLKILSSAIVDRSFDLELQITCRLLSTAVDVSPVKLQA